MVKYSYLITGLYRSFRFQVVEAPRISILPEYESSNVFSPTHRLFLPYLGDNLGRLRLKPDGTRWRTGGEVKGKLANGMGNQYSSHYLGTWCIQHYYRWCAHLGCQQSTELTPPTDLNELVRFCERRNVVSARVSSGSARALTILKHINYKKYILCI